ncbi:MAG TPA: hypothetical protein VK846_07360, partial [Candidatus Limnocylindria bacterium]|nr:hypothetical protein [Candidatus Limnocylindria bacterium]
MTRTAMTRMCVLMLTALCASAQDPLVDIAVPVGPLNEPPGFNIALYALGGRIVGKPSESNSTEWAANNLIGAD